MTKTTIKLTYALLATLLTCTTLVLQAQGGPGGPGGDPDPAIPFDGGISLVIAAGVAYAAKKGYDKRRKQGGRQQAEK